MNHHSGRPSRTDGGDPSEAVRDETNRPTDGRPPPCGRFAALRREWGDSGLNHLADQAGPHRRLAAGIGLLAGPLACMAAVLIGSDGLAVSALAHLGLAGACLWMAFDLVSSGSMLDRHGIPNVSSGALVLAATTYRVATPNAFADDFGLRLPVTIGMVVLGLAVAVLVAADWRDSRGLAFVGRLVLVVGGPILGIAVLVAAGRGASEHVVYSSCLAVVGILLLLMTLFESRLLWRGIELVAVRRGL